MSPLLSSGSDDRVGQREHIKPWRFSSVAVKRVAVLAICLLVFIAAVAIYSRPTLAIPGGCPIDVGRFHAGATCRTRVVVANPHPFSVRVFVETGGCECVSAKPKQFAIGPYGRSSSTVNIAVHGHGPQEQIIGLIATNGRRAASTFVTLKYATE